jgi:predicted unusual protein kinase regulating ubiquinone biosynthesis (AarF/ABC1/UbiB family)
MLRTGSICASLLYKYLTTSSDDVVDKRDAYQQNLLKVKVLGETFANYGGILSKIAQMVSYTYGNHESEVYSNCKPINSEKTTEFFENEILEFEDELLSYETDVFKSGSVGQVHRAVYKDGRHIIFKVQYVGLTELFESDIYILDSIAKFLFYETGIMDGMNDIKKQIFEELDYRIEARNQTLIAEYWSGDKDMIAIPKLIPDLCNEKILCMEYIDNCETLSEFLNTSTLEEITYIGNVLIRFMFTNLFKHKLIYTDVHYGNFMVENKTKLHVLDFGSVNYLADDVHANLFDLLNTVYLSDQDSFFQVMINMGVILPEKPLSEESKVYMWEYFNLQLAPWIYDENDEGFLFTADWVDECGIRDIDLMKEWILPANVIWLNKLCHGFIHILGKMNFRGNSIGLFKELGVYE